jgi:predicted dehydrogenase
MVNNCMREVEKDLRIVAAIDPDEAGVREKLSESEAKEICFYQSVAEMVSKSGVEAIAIGTRCDLHTKYAIEAAATGLPIFLEKPVAISLEQAQALEAAFQTSTSEVVVSFPLRASPLCQRVKELLERGDIGLPEHVLAVNYVPYGDVYFNSWYRDVSLTGGLFLQKATHDFDYLAYCLRSPIVRVASMASKGRIYRDASLRDGGDDENSAYFENIGTPESGMNEDSSSTLLEFANGAKGVYTQVFYAKRGAASRGASFAGQQGTLRFDWCTDKANVYHHQRPFQDEIRVDSDLNHHGGDGVLAENFIKVVKGEAESIANIWQGLSSVYACLAAKESAETGKFCEVRALASSQTQQIK